MKIIILGAGTVGGTLAETLSGEKHDITIVDAASGRLSELQDRLDIRTVAGQASHPRILRDAGAEDADMLIAVTNSDEINMAACQIAYTMFHTPTKIARVRAPEYLRHEELFNDDAFPVDVVISPEELVTQQILNLVEYPGALQVLDFAEGRVRLVAVHAYYGGPLVGNALATLRQHMPKIDARVAAIYRNGRAIKPEGTTIIEADDEIFFVAAQENIRAVMSELQKLEAPYQRIMIAGGGHIGTGIARRLEKTCKVKLIERGADRVKEISEDLHKTLVLKGDATSQDLLEEEDIETVDLFIAVTNSDEANIMSALLAKRLGARKSMVLINRSAYVDLVHGAEIDVAISPQSATISALLTHIRHGDIVNVHSLRRGAAEAIEAVAHGDMKTSKVVGRSIGELQLPLGCTIGAIVRGEDVLIAHDRTRIDNGDHVILFLTEKKYIGEVEKLFQVGVGFI